MDRPDPACVIVPTLDEIAHIDSLLALLSARPASEIGEILVVDGGSTDGTREAVRAQGRRDPRIRLIDNPERVQSAGVNRAAAAADRGLPVLVRLDAHAEYPPDYVARVVQAMAERNATSVVVRLETVGRTRFERAVALVSNSRIGTGGAAHRMDQGSGWVDHGHHAAFRRTAFISAGGYDESFEANEDAELDVRLRAAGGRIWLEAGIPVRYFPRGTLAALARQYRRYGSGRARTFLKHRERLRIRQMLPLLALAGVTTGLLLAPLAPMALVIPAAYGGVVAVAALRLAVTGRSPAALLSAPVLTTMHLSWAFGFLHEITRSMIGRVNADHRTGTAMRSGGRA